MQVARAAHTARAALASRRDADVCFRAVVGGARAGLGARGLAGDARGRGAAGAAAAALGARLQRPLYIQHHHQLQPDQQRRPEEVHVSCHARLYIR